MGMAGILCYSLSALAFGAACGAACLLAGQLSGRRPTIRGLLLAAYLGALLQITALRLGLVTPRWLGGSLCPRLLETTLAEAFGGAWPLVYHIVGNMAWFLPLGLLLPGRAGAGRCLLAGLILSAGIEAVQYLLGTGVSDVDDVLFNTLGALAGLLLRRGLARR